MGKKRKPVQKKSNTGAWMVVGAIVLAGFAGGWLWAGTGDSADGGETVEMVVYQNPACQCCGKWIAHLERNGFDVEVHKTNEVNRVKEREGITPATASCHTGLVDGYVVEGHVPARDVRRMLRDRPDIKGLTVPGMPVGTPGMEGDYRESYDVLAISHTGETSVYSSY